METKILFGHFYFSYIKLDSHKTEFKLKINIFFFMQPSSYDFSNYHWLYAEFIFLCIVVDYTICICKYVDLAYKKANKIKLKNVQTIHLKLPKYWIKYDWRKNWIRFLSNTENVEKTLGDQRAETCTELYALSVSYPTVPIIQKRRSNDWNRWYDKNTIRPVCLDLVWNLWCISRQFF